MKKRIFLKKEDLEELYVRQKLGSRTVGEMLGCSKPMVIVFLKYYGIPIKDGGFGARNRVFSDKERLELSARMTGKNNPNYSRISLKCKHCDKDILVKPSDIIPNKNNFCSKKCFYEWTSKNLVGPNNRNFKSVRVECIICKKIFYLQPYRLKALKYGITCGRICAGKNRSKFITGKNHPNYSSREYNCDYCDKKIIRQPHKRKNHKHLFCDQNCLNLWMKKNWTGNGNHKFNSQYVKCIVCGKEILVSQSRIANRTYGITCSNECRYDVNSLFASGENSPHYKGGKVKNYGTSWPWAKKQARRRDNNTCRGCGITKEQHKGNMHVHHIIPFRFFGKDNHKIGNNLNHLVCYCRVCHTVKDEELRHIIKLLRLIPEDFVEKDSSGKVLYIK